MGTVDVGLVVAGAVGDHIADLLHAQIVSVGGAAHIWHQHHQVKVGVLAQHILADLSGVSQLGNGLGADERGVLQMLHAGIHQQVDDLLFQLRGNKVASDGLEAVTGTNLDNIDFLLFHSSISS